MPKHAPGPCDPPAVCAVAEPNQTADERPKWLRVMRIVVASALLPVALAFIAWPWVLFGGYGLYRVPDGAMEPTYRVGQTLITLRRGEPQPARDRVFVFRWGKDRQTAPRRLRRVVAVEGDIVRIESGLVRRNGLIVPDPETVRSDPSLNVPGHDIRGPEALLATPGDGDVMVTVRDGALLVPDGYCLALPDDRRRISSGEECILVPKEFAEALVLRP